MKELIDSYRKRYYLELGEKEFSPIMETSIGIALDYCKRVQTNNKAPLLMSFPDKSSTSLWLAVGILRNYFASDYLEGATRAVSFKGREKVQIYNTIAEVVNATGEEVILMFKDKVKVSIKKKHWSNIGYAPKGRALNLYKRYLENRHKYSDSRNSISKILEPNESVVINQNNLDSKVLVISGHGSTSFFKDLLNQTSMFNESLAKTFSVDRNIIITQDLKAYNEFFSSDYSERFGNFTRLMSKLIGVLKQEDLKQLVTNFYDKLVIEKSITEEFDVEFRSFFDEYIDVIPNLKFVYNSYPGLKEAIPSKLRAVIINDIRQVAEYENTILAFLEINIPVILVSNRNLLTIKELDFFKQLFRNKTQYYSINWNQSKVKALLKCETGTGYIDRELWRQCRRYANQRILIDVHPEHKLDGLLSKLILWIKELDDYEVLQKGFYRYLYPAIYALKNSNRSNEFIKDLIINFKDIFESVHHLIQQKEIVEDFRNAIFLAMNFDINTKMYDVKGKIFSSHTLLHNTSLKLSIPLDVDYLNTPSSNAYEVLFTGYPYNEYFGRYLLDTVCVNFVPNVRVMCWPNEAMLTYSYLKRRIKSGYFLDNLQELCRFEEKHLLSSEADIEREIDSYIILDKPNVSRIEEEPLDYLHTFKYKGYNVDIEGKCSFTSKCNILNFNDGSFMFLPIGASVLGQSEDYYGSQKVRKQRIDDLHVGDKVFVSTKDRSVYRQLSKTNPYIEKCFQQLEFWKDSLQKLFEECDENLELLEWHLKEVKKENALKKGNPVKSSIQRWLFDDEMISPEVDNLRIILKAVNVENLEAKLSEMEAAYRSVSSFTIGLSSTIKKYIASELSSVSDDVSFFSINIGNIEIVVDVKSISSVDKNEIEVDYRNTRKFLC